MTTTQEEQFNDISIYHVSKNIDINIDAISDSQLVVCDETQNTQYGK